MTEIQHYKDGTVRAIGKINLGGKKLDLWKYYSRFGNLIKEELYEEGRLLWMTEYYEI